MERKRLDLERKRRRKLMDFEVGLKPLLRRFSRERVLEGFWEEEEEEEEKGAFGLRMEAEIDEAWLNWKFE